MEIWKMMKNELLNNSHNGLMSLYRTVESSAPNLFSMGATSLLSRLTTPLKNLANAANQPRFDTSHYSDNKTPSSSTHISAVNTPAEGTIFPKKIMKAPIQNYKYVIRRVGELAFCQSRLLLQQFQHC